MNTKFKMFRLVAKDLIWNKVTRGIYLGLVIFFVIAFGTGPVGFYLADAFWPNVPIVGHSMNLINGDGWVKGQLDEEHKIFPLRDYYNDTMFAEDYDGGFLLTMFAYALFGVFGTIMFLIPLLPLAILFFASLIVFFVIWSVTSFIGWVTNIPFNLKKYKKSLEERV